MTVAICLFHNVTLVEILSFQMFPCDLPILLRAGEFTSPIDGYPRCDPDTKPFWEQFPSSQLTTPFPQQKWLYIPCFGHAFVFSSFLFDWSIQKRKSSSSVQMMVRICVRQSSPTGKNTHLEMKESHLPELME